MAPKPTALYRVCLSKLSRQRIAAIYDDIVGPSTKKSQGTTLKTDRVQHIFEHYKNNTKRLSQFIGDGFSGEYHQTIYIRKVKSDVSDRLDRVRQGDSSVHFLADLAAESDDRILLYMDYPMEFRSGNAILQHTIQVPAVVDLLKTTLTARVLKMRPAEWMPYIGVSVDRATKHVKSEVVRDKVLKLLVELSDPNVGKQANFSTRSKQIMGSKEVDTFRGAYHDVDKAKLTVRTEYSTPGAHGRRPLRTAAYAKFQRLLAADEIAECYISIRKDKFHLKSGTTLRLRPVSGEVHATKMITEGDLDAFVRFCAS